MSLNKQQIKCYETCPYISISTLVMMYTPKSVYAYRITCKSVVKNMFIYRMYLNGL
jgi:hypothetical protein